MATWKKVIVSGSSADLANLHVDSLSSGVVTGAAGNLTTTAINGTGNIVATSGASGLIHSGSFSGSFFGDGSGLTGLATTFRVAGDDLSTNDVNLVQDGVIFTTASNQGFGFTTGSVVTIGSTDYHSVNLIAPQDLKTTANVQFNQVDIAGVAQLNKTVADGLQITAGNGIAFNSQISSSFIPISDNNFDLGSSSTKWSSIYGRFGHFATFVATPYISASGNFQLTSQGEQTITANVGDITLTATAGNVNVEGTTFSGNDVTIPGNLYVQGDTVNINTANLDVEDAFILLASGSAATGDSGIVFGGSTGVAQSGSLMFWDASYNSNDGRLAIKNQVAASVTGNQTPDYHVAGVFEGTEANAATAQADHVGNIRVDGGEIYIYV